MKLWLIGSLSIGLISSAHATQVITCNINDIGTQDQILITLNNDQNGSFAYRTAATSPTSSSDEGSLPLKRTSSPKDIANFLVQSAVMTMNFEMSATLVLAPSDGFTAKLTSVIESMGLNQEQALNCKSRL
jgi:hypothetical protein